MSNHAEAIEKLLALRALVGATSFPIYIWRSNRKKRVAGAYFHHDGGCWVWNARGGQIYRTESLGWRPKGWRKCYERPEHRIDGGNTYDELVAITRRALVTQTYAQNPITNLLQPNTP